MDYEIFKDSEGTEHITIKNADGGFTTMHKSYWDKLQEQQAKQSGTLS